MGAIASQITSLTIVSTVYSDLDQRKHQSSASLAFVRGLHRRSVNSPHKWPVTRKMFPFDDVIMLFWWLFWLTVEWYLFILYRSQAKSVRTPMEGSSSTDIAAIYMGKIHPILHVKHHWYIDISLDKENIKAPRHWPLWGEPPVTGGFPSQRASYAENVSISWRHHASRYDIIWIKIVWPILLWHFGIIVQGTIILSLMMYEWPYKFHSARRNAIIAIHCWPWVRNNLFGA